MERELPGTPVASDAGVAIGRAKAFTAIADRLYGNSGPQGLPFSVAEGYAASVFGPVRQSAVMNNHDDDVKVLDRESESLAKFMHVNFDQKGANEFVTVVRPFVKDVTHVRSEDYLAKAEFDGQLELTRKFGMVKADRIYREAQVSLARITQASPQMRRALVEEGAIHNPDVAIYLADLARTKGWVPNGSESK